MIVWVSWRGDGVGDMVWCYGVTMMWVSWCGDGVVLWCDDVGVMVWCYGVVMLCVCESWCGDDVGVMMCVMVW